jgi:hypothetical protein
MKTKLSFPLDGITLQHVGELLFNIPDTFEERTTCAETYLHCLENFCFATGLELNKYYKRFLLAPYLEFNIGYQDHVPGMNAGTYCGMFFPNKRVK